MLLSYSMLCLISFASYIRVDNENRAKRPKIHWRNPFCCGYFCCKKGKCGRRESIGPWKGVAKEKYLPWYWALVALPTVDWRTKHKMARAAREFAERQADEVRQKAIKEFAKSAEHLIVDIVDTETELEGLSSRPLRSHRKQSDDSSADSSDNESV